MESKMKCKMKELCREIRMPEEVTERLCGDGALQDCGLKNLRNHLEAALEAKEKYDALGIPENIYFDTMAVFPALSGNITPVLAAMDLTGNGGRIGRLG